MFAFFFIWFVLSILVAMYAGKKGRSGFGFFVLSFLLSPLVGLIVALIVDDKSGISSAPPAPTQAWYLPPSDSPKVDDTKKCPFCAEMIKKEAKFCRFCSKELPTHEEKPVKPEEIKEEAIEALMQKYGIKFNMLHGKYSFFGYEFSTIDEAIACAKRLGTNI